MTYLRNDFKCFIYEYVIVIFPKQIKLSLLN